MAKSRKRIFPKPPQRLSSKTAETLGKNSNKVGYHASLKAIYYSEIIPPPKDKPLNDRQQNALDRLQSFLKK